MWSSSLAFVDVIVMSTGVGTTSFEDGLERRDAPAGGPGDDNDGVVGT
jgi:hypothetical protein